MFRLITIKITNCSPCASYCALTKGASISRLLLLTKLCIVYNKQATILRSAFCESPPALVWCHGDVRLWGGATTQTMLVFVTKQKQKCKRTEVSPPLGTILSEDVDSFPAAAPVPDVLSSEVKIPWKIFLIQFSPVHHKCISVLPRGSFWILCQNKHCTETRGY